MMKHFCISLLFTALSLSATAQQLNLIPKPSRVTIKGGTLTLNQQSRIGYNDKKLIEMAGFLSRFLDENYHLQLALKSSRRGGDPMIQLTLDDKMDHEAYKLEIDDHHVSIRGNQTGLFYGLQTLMQLLPPGREAALTLPQVTIEDSPRFHYRGAMLDVARYFYSPGEVKRFIELMAHYKLNVLHWHLTEDAGWRIEIKKYPRLTEIGAWRRGTQRGRPQESFDRLPHGGYYTQEQIRDIVAFAERRHINIIPEIDMPGHTLAALAAYPEISCTGGPFKVLEQWGIQEDVMCAGNERTYRFIEDVMDELLELFPSEIIHIGGDEAPKSRWKECDLCQERIRSEGLENEEELQSYFVKRVGAYLQKRGRKMMGWDEIMEGGLAENAMVMSWRGEAGGIEASNMHHEVVMAPNSFMYLDYYQGSPETEPMNIGGHLPLEKVYSFEPLSEQIAPENRKYVVGVQGNLWMEFIHSYPKLEYMAFPRLLAVAEIGWSDATKDFNDFSDRLSHQLNWLDRKGVNYRIPDVRGSRELVARDGVSYLQLRSPVEGARIYYTLDGEDPLQYGILYTDPVKIEQEQSDSLQLQYIIRTKTGRVSGTRQADPTK